MHEDLTDAAEALEDAAEALEDAAESEAGNDNGGGEENALWDGHEQRLLNLENRQTEILLSLERLETRLTEVASTAYQAEAEASSAQETAQTAIEIAADAETMALTEPSMETVTEAEPVPAEEESLEDRKSVV